MEKMFKQKPRLYIRIVHAGFSFSDENIMWDGEQEDFESLINKWFGKSMAIDMKTVSHLWDNSYEIPMERIFPPFDNIWFETFGEYNRTHQEYCQGGFLCHCQKVKSVSATIDLLKEEMTTHGGMKFIAINCEDGKSFSTILKKSPEYRDEYLNEREGYVYSAFPVFAKASDKPWPPMFRLTFFVQKNGVPVCGRDEYGVYLLGFIRDAFLPKLADWINPEERVVNGQTYEIIKTEGRENYYGSSPDERLNLGMVGYFFGALLRIFHLLNVQNIEIKEIEFPSNYRKIMQRRKINQPKYTYRILTVRKPGLVKTRRNYSVNEQEDVLPLHLVRGHLRTYKPDHPLFGREGLYGTFYIPAHIRGDIRQGLSFKDYKIKSQF